MKILFFLFAFCSVGACKKKTVHHLKENRMQQENLVNLVMQNDIFHVKNALDKGADVNMTDQKGRSLLLIAVVGKQTEMAKVLVAYKADVNLQDTQKDSAFLYAGASGQTELVQLFLKNGARFDVFNRYNGTALIPACERGHVETVKVLAHTKGFPVDHVNRLGWTALMEAVVLGDGSEKYQQIIHILKNAGADLNIPDQDGVTALQHSKSLGFREMVKILES
ncbi:ankyrin repeat domain-containing protein [Chryseobacterium gotjawalense]|uniref:Ankyrin repeat domain-containing protein n=1 Tax=Chryseobacterium gotjawalense TaxID=3042315 RepID=A0ABY8RFE0_9FLAO|nr:ankyrin repeat domain-containing protein [Chryseobacterium sp. wdc7]WHF52521.1 ankyrin repeat domain-containing protein [Chryseobacterium sp. wdc7]